VSLYAGDVALNVTRWLWRLRREPVTVVVDLAQPVLWLILFGHLFSQASAGLGLHVSYLAFMTAGVVVMTVFNVTLGGGLEMMFDRESGMLRRLMASPLHRSSLLVGRFAVVVLLGLAQAVIIVLVGGLMHVSVTTSPADLGLAFAVDVLLGSGIGIVSLVLAMVLKSHGPFYAVIGFVSLPVTFVSTAFAPLATMAPWLRTMASLNPLTYATDAVRDLLLYHASASTVLPLMAYLLGFDAICLGVGLVVFRRALS
jgi:ABC-2 type transport system permease protein